MKVRVLSVTLRLRAWGSRPDCVWPSSCAAQQQMRMPNQCKSKPWDGVDAPMSDSAWRALAQQEGNGQEQHAPGTSFLFFGRAVGPHSGPP